MVESSVEAQKPITFGKYMFNQETRTVSHMSGSSKVLSPDLALILYGLALKKGETFAKEELFQGLCLVKENAPEPKIIDVQICKLRAALKALSDVTTSDSHIVTVWGSGYLLSEEPKPLKSRVHTTHWQRGLGKRMNSIFLEMG